MNRITPFANHAIGWAVLLLIVLEVMGIVALAQFIF